MGMMNQAPGAPDLGGTQVDPAFGTAWGNQQGHARRLTNNLMYQGLVESPMGTYDSVGYTPPSMPSQNNQQAMAMALMQGQKIPTGYWGA